MIATANHPPISLDASNITIRLGDRRLPPFSEFPAWAALTEYLAMILGPIEPGK